METTVIAGQDRIDIPATVTDFDSFRSWLRKEAFPEDIAVSFIHNTVYLDLSRERFFDHGQVKAEVGRVLANLMKETRFGRFAPDGTRYTHLETGFSVEPDGMVISRQRFDDGRVKLVAGDKGLDTKLVGTPDIVIEIVSPSSEEKDTQWLTAAYHAASIPEYWLIDARDEDAIRFEIFKWMKNSYLRSGRRGGWVKSAVLGKSFRLRRAVDESDNPEFTLECR